MIKSSYFAGKKVVVFGLSRTGLGAVKSMMASSANVIASDDNDSQLKALKEKFPLLKVLSLKEIDWQGVDFLLLSPGIPLYAPVVHPVVKAANKRDIPIIADFDVLYFACPTARFIGITGTNGKSTTTALIGHVLGKCGQKVQVGGNIGVSALELEPQDDGYYVLEFSSYQLDLIKFLHVDSALLINITPDHIDRHGTFERYIEAKTKLIDALSPKGTALISIDYPATKRIADTYKHKVTISTHDAAADIYIRGRVLKDNIRDLSFSFVDYTDLPGEHNEENIAAAYGLCTAEGLEPQQIVDAIKSFKGLKHRIETVLTSSRFTFINDSKATNADAAEKALRCYHDIYWIAGGMAKEGGIEPILPLIEDRVRLTLLIGHAQNEFAESLAKMNLPFIKCHTLEQALDYLHNQANASGVVLLSPACASLDQFKDFEHRGDEFRRLATEKFSEE